VKIVASEPRSRGRGDKIWGISLSPGRFWAVVTEGNEVAPTASNTFFAPGKNQNPTLSEP